MTESRTWVVPEDPGDDVTAVIDDDGDRWERASHGEWVCKDSEENTLYWGALLGEYGPLTDATPDQAVASG